MITPYVRVTFATAKIALLVGCAKGVLLLGEDVWREGLASSGKWIGVVAEMGLEVPVESTAGAIHEVVPVLWVVTQVCPEPAVYDGPEDRVLGLTRDEVPVSVVHPVDREEGVLS